MYNNTFRKIPLVAILALATSGCDNNTPSSFVENMLKIDDLYIKPVEPGKNTAAYATFVNTHPFDISITAVDMGCVKNELHTHIHENNVMKMRKVKAFVVPQGGRLTLAPGGDHLMCIDALNLYTEGESINITFTIEAPGVTGQIVASAVVKNPS